jgi:SAM-dependent methyltransferase
MRRQRRSEVEERDRCGRTVCCVVALVNVIVITAYHMNVPSRALAWYHGVPLSERTDRSTGAPMKEAHISRQQMGDSHHRTFDEQHSAVSSHHLFGEEEATTPVGQTSQDGDARIGGLGSGGEVSDFDCDRALSGDTTGGWRFALPPFSTAQFRRGFLTLRPDRPTARPSLRAWLRRCLPVLNSTADQVNHTDQQLLGACHLGYASVAAAAVVRPEMLHAITLNGTVPLRYRYVGAERKREHSQNWDLVDSEAKRPSETPSAVPRLFTDSPDDVAEEIITTAPAPPRLAAPSPSFELHVRRWLPALKPLRVKNHVLQTILEELLTIAKNPAAHRYRGQFVATLQSYAPFFRDKTALVVGSLELPVIEVAALVLGQTSRVVSVEHRPFLLSDSRFECLTPEDFWAARPKRFDAVVSYSILQHDGLGRYGDVLNPDGDLDAMNELWSVLRPGGLLLLTLPVGNDCVRFNSFRVYGRRRLPLLLRGWSVVETRGLPMSTSDADNVFERHDCSATVQPTFVLKRTLPANATAELLRVPGLFGDFPVHFD